MNDNFSKFVAVIVAHPDDETLWAGGTILNHPSWNWFVASLCRGDDAERAKRFYKTLKILNSEGIMGTLNDGPEQTPLDRKVVESAILELLPQTHFDIIITHNPVGEYSRHIRHEEVSNAVINLWFSGKIFANELWTFAYEDGNKSYLPKPVENASIYNTLLKQVWNRKYNIITKTYGFEKSSFEAVTTPMAEAFWKFTDKQKAMNWLNNSGVLHNNFVV